MKQIHNLLRCTSIVCCLGLACLWLAGCDAAPVAISTTTTSLSPTPAVAPATNQPPVPSATLPAATSAPTAAATTAPVPCVLGSDAGRLPLLPIPAAVRGPIALALLQGKVYVAGRRSANLGVIENDRLQSVIPAGDSTIAMAADESSGTLFVLDEKSGQVALYKDAKVQATVVITSVLKPGYGTGSVLLADSSSHRLFVALDSSTPEIVVIDTQTFKVTNRINLPGVSHVGKMALDAQSDRLWFSQFENVSSLDLKTAVVVDSVTLPGSTYGVLLFDPQSRRLYADYYREGSFVAVIESGRPMELIPVGADPAAVVIAGKQLYVANSYSNTVSVIDIPTSRVVSTIPVGVAPRAMLADPQAGRVYVAVTGGYAGEVNRLDVIDTQRNEVSGYVPLSAIVSQLVADNTRRRLYVLLPSSREVLISDGQQVLSRVPLDLAPQQIALDEAAGRLYVTDYVTQRLSVIDVAAGRIVERHELKLATPLDAVAVDGLKKRLLLSNRTFAPGTLAETGHYTLTGFTMPYGDGMIPISLSANPSVPRIYAVASNGVPGSNGGVILYAVDGDSLQQTALAPEQNVSAVILDNAAQRLYETTTHPLGGKTHLNVLDALSLKPIATLDLPAHVSAMTLNEQTHHLYLAYHGYFPNPSPLDNVMQVIDTRTLGKVYSATVESEPAVMAALGDRIFVASNNASSLAVYRDCQADAPAAPTPTMTPTPYPPFPAQPTFAPATVTATTTTSVQRAPTVAPMANCPVAPARWLAQWFGANSPLVPVWSELGCPVGPPRAVQVAIQWFEHGFMLWRADTRKITIAADNFRWTEYDDGWDTSQPEGGTEKPPSAGMLAPKRGFGKVWREKLGGASAAIGWAIQAEQGIASEIQDFPAATALKDYSYGFGVFYRSGIWR